MVIKIPNTIIKSTSLLSLILYFLITTTSNPHSVLGDEVADEEDPEFYILDEALTILSNVTVSSKTRLLVSKYKKIKKGMRCHVESYNICNGFKANNGTSLLHCCKMHCRNILGDMNNCGRCGKKCGFGQRCCGGVCTYVNFNPNHCGKCTRKCKSGFECEYGYCGSSFSGAGEAFSRRRWALSPGTSSSFIFMAFSHFLYRLLLCYNICSIGGGRPQRTQRRSRGLFVSDLPAVLSPQMVSALATSREDSLTAAMFWFLGRVPDEPRSSSYQTGQEIDYVPYFHQPLEHSSYLTSSSLPSPVRTEPLIILCFALSQFSGIRSQISMRPDLNFLDVSSLYSSPKVVLSALAWILLNGCTVSLRRISGDLSYGTVKQPKFDAFCSEQVRCNGLPFTYDWVWPIRATQPASSNRNSPSRSLPKPKLKNEKAFQIITEIFFIRDFRRVNLGSLSTILLCRGDTVTTLPFSYGNRYFLGLGAECMLQFPHRFAILRSGLHGT
uniref:Uncharacterized protein n=1 Tax=Brassica oleracea var. oleracea TaxID=109376 RepID=A0A0D3CQL8_BRAOL